MLDNISYLSTETDTSLTVLEVEQFKKVEKDKNESFINNFLSKIDSYDKKLSNYIHTLELNLILEYMVYIFARLFNFDILIIFYISVFLYQSFMNKNYYYIIKPFIHVSVVFIFSSILLWHCVLAIKGIGGKVHFKIPIS